MFQLLRPGVTTSFLAADAPLERSGLRERRGAEPLEPGPWIGDRRDYVRPVGGAAAVPEVVGAGADADGGSGLEEWRCRRAPIRPASALGSLVGRVPEERESVDKARDRDLPSVKTGRTVVPTGIEGVADVGEDLAIDNVEGVRPGVCTVERQVLPRRGPQADLQRIVVGVRPTFAWGRCLTSPDRAGRGWHLRRPRCNRKCRRKRPGGWDRSVPGC